MKKTYMILTHIIINFCYLFFASVFLIVTIFSVVYSEIDVLAPAAAGSAFVLYFYYSYLKSVIRVIKEYLLLKKKSTTGEKDS